MLTEETADLLPNQCLVRYRGMVRPGGGNGGPCTGGAPPLLRCRPNAAPPLCGQKELSWRQIATPFWALLHPPPCPPRFCRWLTC